MVIAFNGASGNCTQRRLASPIKQTIEITYFLITEEKCNAISSLPPLKKGKKYNIKPRSITLNPYYV